LNYQFLLLLLFHQNLGSRHFLSFQQFPDFQDFLQLQQLLQFPDFQDFLQLQQIQQFPDFQDFLQLQQIQQFLDFPDFLDYLFQKYLLFLFFLAEPKYLEKRM
jgi:hypothetical protein